MCAPFRIAVSFIFTLLIAGSLTGCSWNIFRSISKQIARLTRFPKIENVGTGPNPVRWTMIDATEYDKQADAHLIEFPDGTKFLIDSGFTGNKVVPYLKRHNVSQLEGIVITHLHKDHYGGMLATIESGVAVKEVRLNVPDKALCDLEGQERCDAPHIARTIQELKTRQISVLPAKAGDTLYTTPDGKTSLQVLYAYRGADSPIGFAGGVNDTSLIILLTHGTNRVLFTGDLNGPLGEYLAKNGKNLQAQVLKVPHHGTEGCAPDSFFDRVAPKLALVPAPIELWLSDRSKRIRNYFESRHIPVRVSGADGDVTVLLGPENKADPSLR